MAGPQQLLRKAAVERMSSPEQLDAMMRVTSPKGWVALAAIGGILFGVIVWSIVGRLSVKVDGTGILLRGETVEAVQMAAAGSVQKVLVSEGDLVATGQVVANIAVPDLEAQITATRDQVRALEGQQAVQSGQVMSLEESYRAQLRDLESQRANTQRMYEKGLARQRDVLAIQGQIASVRAQMLQSQLGQAGRGNQLDDARRKLQQLQASFEASSVVRSPYAGRVVAILVSPGQLLNAGSKLMTLESENAPFQVVIFIPFTEGKKVQEGMEVRILPTNLHAEDVGFILGRIERVSSYAVTPEEVRRTLANDQMAARFVDQTPFKVRAAPILDPATPSGFKWTSSKGPPIKISGGTPCSAQVIVEERRPISLVIPLLKKTLGVS